MFHNLQSTTSLTSLSLSGCNIGPTGLQALITSSLHKQLCFLDLSKNSIGREGDLWAEGSRDNTYDFARTHILHLRTYACMHANVCPTEQNFVTPPALQPEWAKIIILKKVTITLWPVSSLAVRGVAKFPFCRARVLA